MKKLFMPYYILIVTLGLLIITNELMFKKIHFELSTTSIIILIMAIISETIYYYFTKNTSVTLSSSIIIFSTMELPFLSVIGVVLCFVIFGRISGVLRKELKQVVDMKWLFNSASFVITAKFSSLVLQKLDFKYLSNVDQVIVIFGLCMCYVLLNFILTYTVISLSTGENAFKDQMFSEFLVFSFYTIMFTSLLWFGYSSYGDISLLFLAVLIIPLQRSIVMQSKLSEITQRLIEDSLTSAYNRQYFDDLIYEKLAKKMEFSLIFLDMDKFKSINDTYGHLTGDEVLMDLVSKIKSFLRKDDCIVRYGGDEFCIVTYDNAFGEILMTLLRKNKSHFILDTGGNTINYSFTMSLVSYDGQGPETYRNIMKQADANMYERKRVS